MKKIAFICELVGTVRQGGENIAMLRMANELKKSHFVVDVYTYTNADPQFKITSVIPLSLRLIPFVREICFAPFIGFRLIKKLDKQYTAIFASTMTIASFIKPRASLIITCHLIRSQKFASLAKIPKYRLLFNPFSYFLMTTLERLSLNNAHKIIVIREQQKTYLTEILGINADKIHIIPNGVDASFFKPQKRKKKNQIIFVGRGTLPKGIDILLAAADHINATILIVTQKIDPSFIKIAQQKPNVVISYGASAEEMKDFYAESKIFVLPSLNEEQPLSTMEAMACGLPVVVTPEAASDIAQDNINGYIIPEHDSKELSKKVNMLLLDSELRKKMGTTNRKHIVENYDLTTITRATKLLLND